MNTESALLREVVAIVRDAGAIIKDHAAKPRDVHYKGRIDLVTATDVAVENAIRGRLAALFPGSSFLAEEGSPDTELAENTWIIDPVDGTTNFVHGIPFVGTSVALWRNGEVVLGVVNAPLLDECFTALKGQGAYRNESRITVSATDRLDHSLVATGFPYAFAENLPGLLRRMGRVLSGSRGLRRCGAAALDLAYVAAGRYDGFYEHGLKPWDVAAGLLLVREAGGVVTKTDGSPYTLGAEGILATNGRVHDALQKLMHDDQEAEETRTQKR